MKKLTKYFGASTLMFSLGVAGPAMADERPIVGDGVRIPQNAQNREVTHRHAQGRLYRLDNLIGADIKNPAGEELGDVKDLVFNPVDGSVRYAVVSYGGFLNLGDKLFAVPMRALRPLPDNAGDATFSLNVTEQQFDDARGFDDDHYPDFADPQFAGAVNRTYGVTDQPAAAGSGGPLYRLSSFDGLDVRDRSGNAIGEVEWPLVDAAASRVAYLALDVERDNGVVGQDRVTVIPMSRFTVVDGKRNTVGTDADAYLRFNGDASEVRNAPGVNRDDFNRNDATWRLDADRRFNAAANETGRVLDRTGRTLEQAGERTLDATGRAANATGRAAERAGNAVINGTERAAEGTGRVLNEAGREVGNAVDNVFGN